MALFDALESKYGLPAGILDRMWAAESGRGHSMISPKGALGHFQFMPPTAKAYGLKDPFDLSQSADAAARYLRDLKNQFGDWTDAVAAYNWGPGNLQRHGLAHAPAETRAYVVKVTGSEPRRPGIADAYAKAAEEKGPIVDWSAISKLIANTRIPPATADVLPMLLGQPPMRAPLQLMEPLRRIGEAAERLLGLPVAPAKTPAKPKPAAADGWQPVTDPREADAARQALQGWQPVTDPQEAEMARRALSTPQLSPVLPTMSQEWQEERQEEEAF